MQNQEKDETVWKFVKGLETTQHLHVLNIDILHSRSCTVIRTRMWASCLHQFQTLTTSIQRTASITVAWNVCDFWTKLFPTLMRYVVPFITLRGQILYVIIMTIMLSPQRSNITTIRLSHPQSSLSPSSTIVPYNIITIIIGTIYDHASHRPTSNRISLLSFLTYRDLKT
jgi:hypothetical protein